MRGSLSWNNIPLVVFAAMTTFLRFKFMVIFMTLPGSFVLFERTFSFARRGDGKGVGTSVGGVVAVNVGFSVGGVVGCCV